MIQHFQVAVLYLFYLCNNCMGDSLKVKAPDARKITLTEFKPKEEGENVGKLYFKPKKQDKEMLHGSVIWFKPKEGQGRRGKIS